MVAKKHINCNRKELPGPNNVVDMSFGLVWGATCQHAEMAEDGGGGRWWCHGGCHVVVVT